jgi:hypothetical protein
LRDARKIGGVFGKSPLLCKRRVSLRPRLTLRAQAVAKGISNKQAPLEETFAFAAQQARGLLTPSTPSLLLKLSGTSAFGAETRPRAEASLFFAAASSPEQDAERRAKARRGRLAPRCRARPCRQWPRSSVCERTVSAHALRLVSSAALPQERKAAKIRGGDVLGQTANHRLKRGFASLLSNFSRKMNEFGSPIT